MPELDPKQNSIDVSGQVEEPASVSSWASSREREPGRPAFAWYQPKFIDLKAADAAAHPPFARRAVPFIVVAVLVSVGLVPAILGQLAGTAPAKAAAVAFLPTSNAAARPPAALQTPSLESLRHHVEAAFARPPVARVTPKQTKAYLPSTAALTRRMTLPFVRPATPRPIVRSREVYADGLSYSYQWEAVRGRTDGRARGMSERTFVPGATASLAFTGHGITVYGVRGIRGGSAAIAIDGVVRAPHASFAARVKRTHFPVFTTNHLTDGPHTLAITVLPDAPRGYVNVESAEIRL